MSRIDTTIDRMNTSHIPDRMAEEVMSAMKERGISQREMSRRTGIPLNTLSARLQPGTSRVFNIVELAAVVGVLNISFTELALRAERQPVAA